MWKIRNVDIPCAGEMKIDVVFIENSQESGGKSQSPSKKQFETLMYVSALPDTYIKKQSTIVRKYCLELIYHGGRKIHDQVNLFRIEDHFKVKELIIPLETSDHAYHYLFKCDCDWQEAQGMSLLCRNDEIIGVTE